MPTAVEAISEIFPLESIKFIRANALFTFQTIPASVAEDGATNLLYTFTRTGATTNALNVNY